MCPQPAQAVDGTAVGQAIAAEFDRQQRTPATTAHQARDNRGGAPVGGAHFAETVSFFSIPFLQATDFGPSSLITRFADPVVDCTAPKARAVALTVTCPKRTLPSGHTPPADLPVVVFIHGGRYEEGSHDGGWYQGVRFAESGCVYVSVGYRTGLEGFATFHDDTPGQYRGIGDCQLALEWVQKNIEAFGGDPTNVTLMGQSAGAGIALWLARKDHFRGGFRRIVAASPGFPRQSFTQRLPWLRFFLGSPITRRHLISLARNKPHKLAKGYRAFRTRFITDAALGPYPWRNQELSPVDILLTHTRDEFYLEPVAAAADRRGIGRALARLMGRSLGVRGNVRDYLRRAAAIDPNRIAGRMVGDSTIRRWVADVAEGAPGRVWMAEFVGSASRPAVHCADIPLVFGCFDRHPRRVENFLCGPVDEHVVASAALIHDAVVRFAHGEDPAWRPYKQGRSQVQVDIFSAQVSRTQDSLKAVRMAWPPSEPADVEDLPDISPDAS
ncbi:carboxylesterase family protein [Corynebacterium aquilae]|uniref:carboxylesterase family protein n=1 Tax=Corynebacterium aquilae TaxID=203263 RepID=UPI0014742A47|nr:carboxylesterase family protein [Corynebacterium aquilae]